MSEQNRSPYPPEHQPSTTFEYRDGVPYVRCSCGWYDVWWRFDQHAKEARAA